MKRRALLPILLAFDLSPGSTASRIFGFLYELR
jgi:hypothetical protein